MSAATDPNYNLDGQSGTSAETAAASAVVQAVFVGISKEDAAELDVRIYGAPAMRLSAITGGDLRGRVKWDTNGNVRVYLGHK